MLRFKRTWLEPEQVCYPYARQVRKGKAICEDGVIRTVYAGVADTFFSIPAHTRVRGKYVGGFLTVDSDDEGERELYFDAYSKYDHLFR